MPTNPPGYMKAYRERKKAEAIEILGGHCVKCGSTEDLEFHHIRGQTAFVGKSRGRGSTARVKDWFDSIAVGNLELQCEHCHRLTHGNAPKAVAETA